MKTLLTVKHLYHEAGRNERAALEFKQRLASLVKACSLGPSK
jgi:hypothetical protein